MDLKQRQQTNKKLAAAIGIGGMSAFGLCYVLFFLIMILRPGLLFSILSIPAVTNSAVSDGDSIWLLSQKPDMKNFSPSRDQEPEMLYFIARLENRDLKKAIAIPPYDNVIGGGNRLVFLSEGSYRIYDGSRWVETRTMDAIGEDPRGALSPDGMYVISISHQVSRLINIKDHAATTIPLPQTFLEAEKKSPCPCARIVWYRGTLCLFWRGDGSLSWTYWNGSTWAPVAVSPGFSGGFDVIADADRLYFFLREGEGPHRTLSLYTYENSAWSGPAQLPITGAFTEWDVLLGQGKLKLFTQQFPGKQTLSTITDGRLVDTIQLGSPFRPIRMFQAIAVLAVVLYAMLFLLIYGVSWVITKYKLQSWTEQESTYEFASLFRRFSAYLIDSVLLIMPIAAAAAVVIGSKDFTTNPFKPVLLVLSVVVFYFGGGFLYHSLLEGMVGQTVGKKLCGIRVLKVDFTPCSLSAGFLRNMLRVVDAFFYYLAATVCLAATLKWQRFGDMVAETVVVREKK